MEGVVNSQEVWRIVGRREDTNEYDEKDDEEPHAGLETCAQSASEEAELLLPLKKLKHPKGDNLN